MSNEHFLFGEEPSWGAWTAPDMALPVRSAEINPATTQMQSGVTGGGRARRPGAAGEITVNGPVTTLLYPQTLGYLVRSLFLARVADAAGTGFKNKLLPDDDVANESFSIQKRYSATRVESIKGAKINTLTLAARSREYATVTMAFAAKDAAATGGAFSDAPDAATIVSSSVANPSVITTAAAHGLTTGDRVTIAGHTGSTPDINGTHTVTVLSATTFSIPINVTVAGADGTVTEAAPAVVDPVPYETGLADGLKFYEGEFILGGTTAIVDDEIVVTGGAARCEVDNIELEANINLGTDDFGFCLGDRGVKSLDEGGRELTLRFDPNFATVGFEFYNAWLNGTPGVAQLHFRGPTFDTGQYFDLRLVLPYVVYTNAANPPINAEYGVKRTTVEADAYLDPTLDVDWGLTWTTTDDLTA